MKIVKRRDSGFVIKEFCLYMWYVCFFFVIFEKLVRSSEDKNKVFKMVKLIKVYVFGFVKIFVKFKWYILFVFLINFLCVIGSIKISIVGIMKFEILEIYFMIFFFFVVLEKMRKLFWIVKSSKMIFFGINKMVFSMKVVLGKKLKRVIMIVMIKILVIFYVGDK